RSCACGSMVMVIGSPWLLSGAIVRPLPGPGWGPPAESPESRHGPGRPSGQIRRAAVDLRQANPRRYFSGDAGTHEATNERSTDAAGGMEQQAGTAVRPHQAGVEEAG